MPAITMVLPPDGAPPMGVEEKTISGENSEVEPFEFVAVAVTGWPAVVAVGSRTLNEAVPDEFVETSAEPRYWSA
jgi:hypothetical protein